MEGLKTVEQDRIETTKVSPVSRVKKDYKNKEHDEMGAFDLRK